MKAKNTVFLVLLMTFFIIYQVKAQEHFPVIHHSKLTLSQLKTSFVYDQDSIKFYLNKNELMYYLKSAIKKNPESKDYLLLKKIQTSGSLFVRDNSLAFDKSSGIMDTTHLENYYQLSIKRILPYMLPNGKISIFDNKKKEFIRQIQLKDNLTSDFLGLKYSISLYNKNGKIIYHQNIRDMVGEVL